MRKVILFITKENFEVDEQINYFVENNDAIIVDVKCNTFLDTTHDIIMTSALLIYEEHHDPESYKQYLGCFDDVSANGVCTGESPNES